MNYLVKRKIKSIIKRAKESRNLFMKLRIHSPVHYKQLDIKRRAQFFHELQNELKKKLIQTDEMFTDHIFKRYRKSSFYDTNQLEKKIGYSQFDELIKIGDQKCLASLQCLLNENRLSRHFKNDIQANIKKLSEMRSLSEIRNTSNDSIMMNL